MNDIPISPKVRGLVKWLNENGFETTDSGDGSNHAAGMEGAVTFPMVAMVTTPEKLVDEARRLLDLLYGPQAQVMFACDAETNIEASFSPLDGIALMVLTHVVDR